MCYARGLDGERPRGGQELLELLRRLGRGEHGVEQLHRPMPEVLLLPVLLARVLRWSSTSHNYVCMYTMLCKYGREGEY